MKITCKASDAAENLQLYRVVRFFRLWSSCTTHISTDVQRITLNASSCMMISGGRTEQLDIIAGLLLRRWLYEWFSQFHRCGTYVVLSRSHSFVFTKFLASVSQKSIFDVYDTCKSISTSFSTFLQLNVIVTIIIPCHTSTLLLQGCPHLVLGKSKSECHDDLLYVKFSASFFHLSKRIFLWQCSNVVLQSVVFL